MPELETTKGHCPTCDAERHADIVGQHVDEGEDTESGIWGKSTYYILKCRGCETVYFREDHQHSEDWDHSHNPHTGEVETYYPVKTTYHPAPSKRSLPGWNWHLSILDHDLDALTTEVYRALDADAPVLAAVGIRTVFDRSSQLLKVDPELTFAEKLDALVRSGAIGKDERDSLKALTDAGSAAAHRGWSPKPAHLNTMMSILENFLYRSFILKAEAANLSEAIPPRRKGSEPT
jgi:hypothetical protein